MSLFVALLSAIPARALTINVTYDASVTNIGTLAQVQTAFGAAAQTIQNLYTNSSTVNITVYSAYAGPFGDIDLGENYATFAGSPGFKYAQLKSALSSARTTAADSNSVASLPSSDPLGGATNVWWLARAEAKALNVLVASNDPGNDGSVGFATNIFYTFDPNDRAVPGAIDFIGVAEHELTEVMGRTTLRLSTNFVPFDLFRFTNSGARNFNPYAGNVYFSVDDGTTVLKNFYPDIATGDIQDWQSGATADAFDAYATYGAEETLSAADLTAVDILGYKLNYQPPRLTGTRLANETFQLDFTNTPGTAYTVLASTNLSLSAGNWSVLGTTTETLAGQFRFTDTQATNNQMRFYRVRLN